MAWPSWGEPALTIVRALLRQTVALALKPVCLKDFEAFDEQLMQSRDLFTSAKVIKVVTRCISTTEM